MDIKLIRTRWAAVGAAVAITLGAGGIGITQATTSSGERAIYTPINPCRLADLRPAPDTVGTRTAGLGPDETYTLDGWGMVGDCDLPTGTTGLALNVTAVGPTAPTFLRLWPAGGTQPTTSNLNPTPGQPPTPNAVNVGLSATGQFSIFNRFGIVNVIIDVVGVYDDHNHDDRYYQKSEVDAAVGAKANSADVYTKTETDAALGAKANSADVYTKTEADAALATKADAADTIWAVVQADGTIRRSNDPGASATLSGTGNFLFATSRDISHCAFIATLGSGVMGPGPNEGEITVRNEASSVNNVYVQTNDSSGTPEARDFHITVHC